MKCRYSLFVIAVLGKTMPPRSIWYLIGVCSVLSLSLSLPPISLKTLGYNDSLGCWFVGDHYRLYVWSFYYGPAFGVGLLNVVFAIANFVALMVLSTTDH